MLLKEFLKKTDYFEFLSINLINANIFNGTRAELETDDNWPGLLDVEILDHHPISSEGIPSGYNIVLNYKIKFNSKKHEVIKFDLTALENDEDIDPYIPYIVKFINEKIEKEQNNE